MAFNFGQLLQIAIYAVLGIQQVHGDAVSGADKKTMAQDALGVAAAAAQNVLAPGSKNAALAGAAAQAASVAIDTAVAISKLNGSYQAATAQAQSAQTAAAATPVVTQ